MDASSSSSSTNPTPPSTLSIAELRTWLLDCATELADLETQLERSPSAPNASWNALSVRLALISEILAAQRSGAALVTAEQQLLDLLLSASMSRLRQAIAAVPPPPPPNGGPELPLD